VGDIRCLMPESAPEEPSAYERRRMTLKSIIDHFLRRRFPQLTLMGSFGYGDFHLRIDGSETYSDLDLVLLGCTDDVRFPLAERIAAGLDELGVAISVSVQPGDMFSALHRTSSQFLHLGEFLRRSVPLDLDDPRLDYLRAKLCLSLLKRDVGCRYSDVLEEYRDKARVPHDVKLGRASVFSGPQLLALVDELTDVPPAMLAYVEVAGQTRSFGPGLANLYLRDLNKLPDIPDWLRTLMTRLIQDVSKKP
jgi:hypothetical protein